MTAAARFARNRLAVAGLALVALFTAAALLAPAIQPYDPVQPSWTAVRKPPSARHWLGTDELGRDVASRVLAGARASLLVGVVSVAIAFAAGVPVGLLAGYAGGWLDAGLMRVVDAVLAVPALILAIALSAFLGPSLANAMVAIGLAAAPTFARLARGQALAVKVEAYVEAARAIGAPPWRIVARHLFPNALPPLLVQATLSIASAVIAEAALSYLGLGRQPPSPSWGSMLRDAIGFLGDAPWMAVYPGLAMSLTVLGFNLLGDGLGDALDPRRS